MMLLTMHVSLQPLLLSANQQVPLQNQKSEGWGWTGSSFSYLSRGRSVGSASALHLHFCFYGKDYVKVIADQQIPPAIDFPPARKEIQTILFLKAGNI